MGIYSMNESDNEDFGLDLDALVEAFLLDDLIHNYNEETVQEFCAPGGVGEALLEAKVLSNKRTMVRLSKQSDLERRKIITAIQMAKSRKDPLYDKLVKYQVLRKQVRAKIVAKYGNMAGRTAVKAQKAYVKTMRGVNLANSGNAAFITHDPNR